jgi:hypothetical protein
MEEESFLETEPEESIPHTHALFLYDKFCYSSSRVTCGPIFSSGFQLKLYEYISNIII